MICPICRFPEQDVTRKPGAGEKFIFKCARCGKFKISYSARLAANKKNPGPKICGWIRNLQELGMDVPEIETRTLAEIEQSIPDYNPSDKQYLFLRNLSRRSRFPGDSVSIRPALDYPLAWASASEEILFYIRFLVERDLLVWTGERENSLTRGDDSVSVAVSPHGWAYLDEYEQRAIELSQAYVAMPFSPSMKTAWEKAVKPAINEAGYKACCVDIENQTDRINAKMIAEIRNSLFVVAETTENRQIVYFEAGYATGRNLPVIWCVRRDNLKNVKFDTRQYNHVVWETPQELKGKLYDAVCAVVGRRKKI